MSLRALSFSVLPGEAVEGPVWAEVSALFSSAYGVYSAKAPVRPGARIRMGAGYYAKAYARPGFSVALCRDGARLVAHAVYLDCATAHGRVALVVQLVVASDYRRQGVASALLHAIWGFSDHCAWGIVSSNAFTVRTLEAATFRKARSDVLRREAAWLKEEVLSRVPFLAAAPWRVTDEASVVDTRFFTDRSDGASEAPDVAARLGRLAEGEEWLAFVFREQDLDDFTAYRGMVEASADWVRDAYRRMPQGAQPWAARTADEVDCLLSALPEVHRDAVIVDFGAGTGRHVAELRRRGFARATGIDFAADGASDFVQRADCRTWRSAEPVDLALCLYDVVGSFPDDGENWRIVANVAANLRPGGLAAFSVSNWDFMDRNGCRAIDPTNEERALKDIFALPPSQAMQTDGEFFDGRRVLVDPSRRVVFHKEQFPAGRGLLPGEYLMRDRRFTASEISEWLEAVGLKVFATHFVRAGFKPGHDASTGKEILLFARKVTEL